MRDVDESKGPMAGDSGSPAAGSSAPQRYQDGTYLEFTGGSWHLEDSPYKAGEILKMVRKHSLEVHTVCEIGCGAGGILANLQEAMDRSTEFVGFEVSPQAHEMATKKFGRERLSFRLGDAFDSQEVFDLVLAMDVIEHVEDYFSFLRKMKQKGKYKILKIPLDLHCSAILRDQLTYAWTNTGHIHSFTPSTALEALKYCGYDIVDHFLTRSTQGSGSARLRTRVMNVFRGLIPSGLCTKLVGGYSLLVLAR